MCEAERFNTIFMEKRIKPVGKNKNGGEMNKVNGSKKEKFVFYTILSSNIRTFKHDNCKKKKVNIQLLVMNLLLQYFFRTCISNYKSFQMGIK